MVVRVAGISLLLFRQWKRWGIGPCMGFILARVHSIVYITKHFARKFCKVIPSRSLCLVSGTAGQCATGLCQWSNLLRAPTRTSATWANTISACVNHLCRVTNTLYTCVNTFCHHVIHSCHVCKTLLSPHQTLFTHKTGDFDTLTNAFVTCVNDVCHPDRRSLHMCK